MQERWDVIIVGARCSGATLATHLARAGMRVLLLEASGRGTNMPMSTHYVQVPGMDALDRLGIGARVRARTPATARFRYALDASQLIGRAAPGREAYCVRRSTLDPWLQEAAEEAGAQLRFRERVVELIRTGERVTGVVCRGEHGAQQLHADLVVGADGLRSTIAQLTAAEEYLITDGSRAGYFTYYPAPERWTADWDATLEHRGSELRYVFRSDGDRVLLTYVGPQAEVHAWGSDHRARLHAAFLGSDSTRALCEGKEPVGGITGVLSTRFYYRKPIGPGYALVGDAGHFKDFVTGQGMADAFLDAERLARAILDGRDAAFEHYWHERDVATMPLHFDAIRQGEVGFNEPFMRELIRYASTRPELVARFMQVVERTIEPGELMSMPRMLRMVGAALLRGHVDVLRGFLQTGRRIGVEKQHMGDGKRALARAQRALELQVPRVEPTRARAA